MWRKGLKGKKVIYIHALKNALLPVITLMGLRMGGMLGGSVFVIPGMGVAAGECHFHAGHSADSRVRAADCTVHQRRQVRWTRWRFSGRWMRRKAKAAWSSCRKERT